MNLARPALRGFLVAAALVSASPLHAEDTSSRDSYVSLKGLQQAIPQFSLVDEGLYRGSQPDEEAFGMLRDFGIRTVINFRNERQWLDWEKKTVEGLGMNYVSLPWKMQEQPPEFLMRDFLTLVAQRDRGPFFMHCKRGVERTGVADAIYRWFYRKIPSEQAWKEATDGRPVLVYWRPFMRKRYSYFLKTLESSEASLSR